MILKIYNNDINLCYVERLNNYNMNNFYYNLHLANYGEVVDYILKKETISYYDISNYKIKLSYYNLSYNNRFFVYE
jgi:hypothetical protein